MSNTPNLDISYLQVAQAQKEVTTNTAIQILDTYAGIGSLTVVNGSNTPSEAQCQAGLLVLSGALTASATVVIPATLGKRTQILNMCTGAAVSVQPYGFTAVNCPYNVIVDVWPGSATGYGAGQNNELQTVAVTSTAQSLTTVEAAAEIIEFTGTLTANTVITVPAAVSQWIVYNNTTGAYTLTVQPTGGTGVVVAQGAASFLFCNGTNVINAGSTGISSITESSSVTGAITFAGSGVSQSGNTFTFAGSALTESFVTWNYPAVGATYTFSSPSYPMTLAVLNGNASGTVNVQLPTQPTQGSILRIKNASSGGSTTILPFGSGQGIDSSVTNLVLTGAHSCVVLQAGQTNAAPGWNIISQF